MKGIIKLFPALNPTQHFVVGAFVKYTGEIHKVTKVNKVTLKLDNGERVNKLKCVLMKYYVVKKSVKGELNYTQYNMVKDGDIVEYDTKIIPNKTELGDEVLLYKPLLHNLAKYHFKPISGVITNIQSGNHTISANGNDIINVKRHRFKIISRPDKRVICTIKI